MCNYRDWQTGNEKSIDSEQSSMTIVSIEFDSSIVVVLVFLYKLIELNELFLLMQVDVYEYHSVLVYID